MTVPYSFAASTSAIPLSQLDSNFNTTITLGNTAIQLGNTVTTLNNMTLANVTISSGNVTITNVTVTTANVTTLNATTVIATTANVTTANISTDNVTFANITGANVTTANVTTLSLTNNPTLSGGTANGVLYLNGSKVATSGSVLTFDGQTLTNTRDTPIFVLNDTASSNVALRLLSTGGVTYVQSGISAGAFSPIAFTTNGGASEQMRLNSTGLGIGTTLPGFKLQVIGTTQLSLSGAGTQQALQLNNSDTTAGTQAVKLGFSSAGVTKASINAAVYGNDYMTFNVGSDTERARIDSSGNVRVGTAAIATNATDGFLYIPTCAGTPTGTPTAITGLAPMVIDSTNNKMYIYSGGAWRALN